MTGSEERALLREYRETCARLRDGLARAAEQVDGMLPIDGSMVDRLPIDRENLILAYLKRFEQFEDALGRTIKTIAQIMALGRVERLHPRDVANRAEAYGIIDDAERWAEAVRTRNALAHEYPLRPDKRAAQMNRAWDARAILEEAWSGLNVFIEREGLLDDAD
ncbi:nucleotidyltransferase substrate binding protein [Sphingomonas hankookensis]|uniref:Nucleotidyltransferase n=1 Tax=Sphingomonas hengshuiensis TaxID=1609977 RepID=A0A2W4Z3R8_9SPHN|nr:MAG: hypothetical protein DI632_13460 [Sphingomonas hengshuiensis]